MNDTLVAQALELGSVVVALLAKVRILLGPSHCYLTKRLQVCIQRCRRGDLLPLSLLAPLDRALLPKAGSSAGQAPLAQLQEK